MDDINNYIDQSNYHITHYDIAIIVHKVFKSYYRYIGQNKWEFFDKNENIWKSNGKKNLRIDIKTIISDLFITRSLYWYNFSHDVQDINTEIHVKLMADKMLKISNKLKDNVFVSVVIKEAQPFFDIHNND